MLDTRKKQLFLELTREHIETGNPVGSKVLSQKNGIERSSATVRNEFSDLEKEGLIFQPHTSAGRIPTEKGWKFYIEQVLEEKAPTKKAKAELDAVCRKEASDAESQLKSVAKTLADLSRKAAFVGFSKDNVYYTGLSYLFNEPEFEEVSLVRNMSEIIDHLDDVMAQLFDSFHEGTHVLVGRDNPFGSECGVVLNASTRKGQRQLYGVLGPIRMPYDVNLGLVNYAHTLLTR